MAAANPSPTMKKTLGLTGVTVNAMALIAPGAFLWMTYQLQAANTDISGKSTALDMWTGIVVALIIAFLTAFAFAELARRYPNAGSGSAYYFAEKAFLGSGKPSPPAFRPNRQIYHRLGCAFILLGLSRRNGCFFCCACDIYSRSIWPGHSHMGTDYYRLRFLGSGRLYRHAGNHRFNNSQYRNQYHSTYRAGGVLSFSDHVPG